MDRKLLTNIIRVSIVWLSMFVAVAFPQQSGYDKPIKQGYWKGNLVRYVANELCIFKNDGILKSNIEHLLLPYHGKLKREFDKFNFSVVSFPDTVNVLDVVKKLANSQFIKAIEPNLIHTIFYTPNDPDFLAGKQWGLYNYGQNPPNGTYDADIDILKAWDISMGNWEIKAGVMDSGIPLDQNGTHSHTDLNDQARFLLGLNFVDGLSVKDGYGHGTHVLGIIGAETNNNEGIAGVANRCRYLVIKSIDNTGYGNDEDFRDGVLYAVDNGVDIINYSAGNPDSWVATTAQIEAVNYARDNDVLLIASAGNEGAPSSVRYPAAFAGTYDNVICVSSTDADDNISDFSNYNQYQTTVFAPGGQGLPHSDNDIYSTLPGYGNDPSYGYMAGTSQAAPFVSGVAALILSIKSTLSPLQVKTILVTTADDLSGPPQGRLNAYEALKYTIENHGGVIGGNGATVTFHEDITINSGVELTIASGTTVEFKPDKKLIVKGTLNADDVEFESTSSYGEWGGLVFDGSSCSSSELYECTIENATVGIAITGSNASPTIEKCLVQNCDSYPLKLTSDCTPNIYNNKFYSNSSPAVYISSADGDFSDNEFRTSSGTAYGVYVTGASSAPDFDSNEGINGNLFDLSAISSHGAYIAGGYPEFGDNGPHDGLNDFINRGTDKYIYNNTGSTVDAEVNYWGGTPQSTWFSGSVDFSPYESSANGAGPTWKVASNPYATGVDLFEEGKYDQALAELKSTLLQNSELENAPGAVFKMAKSALKLGRLASEADFLHDLLNSSNSEVRYISRAWLAYLYAMLGDAEEAEKLALQAPEGTRAQRAELLSVVSYYITTGKEKSAERIAQLMREKYRDDYLEFDLEVALKTKIDFPKSLGKTVADVPESFHFINYPNPFNPATTIQFYLPEEKTVTLQIFDIRGRLIHTLFDREMTTGIHSVRWNGKNSMGHEISAGLYFAKLKTNDRIDTIKLLLVR
ncbi:MAG: S8 family serine peptidase [Deferribacteres bacterium]|nr:S8 family serine peptidase [Deferribacteres bacterium]